MGKVHDAARSGEIAKLTAILPVSAVGAQAVINEADKHGNTALHISSTQGHLDMTKFLLEHRADVDRKGADGKTPAQLAMLHDHDHVLKLLLEVSNPANDGTES